MKIKAEMRAIRGGRSSFTDGWLIGFFCGALLASAVFVLIILFSGTVDSVCLHPPDATWDIWWAACQDEGYSFHDSYKVWVEATQHGGDLLEMPKTWA